MVAGIRARDLRGLRTECAGFGVDAETLQGELPTPEQDITDELNNALSGFYNASLECYQASSFTSPAFHRYQSELKSALVLYNDVTKRLYNDGVR
jgi:hypothetical protein